MNKDTEIADWLMAEAAEKFKHLYRECEHGIQIEKCKFCSYHGQDLPCMHGIRKRNCSLCMGAQAVAKIMTNRVRKRAKDRGTDFTLTFDEIFQKVKDTNGVCLILGTKLRMGGGRRGYSEKWDSPSLDRIDNTKGYMFENTIVISWRANALKSNATFDELRKLADFYGKYDYENQERIAIQTESDEQSI